jgi:hypothetical protein
MESLMRRTVWLVVAVVIGPAACGHEPPDDGRALSVGGGDGEFVAGDGRAIGEVHVGAAAREDGAGKEAAQGGKARAAAARRAGREARA